MTSGSPEHPKNKRNERLIWLAILYLASSITYALAQQGNGIHVGSPKVYDSRELTLMLDNLSQQLQNRNFIDPKALAAALGNIQGYQSSDFSLSAFANGGVGAEAASVFAGAGSGTITPPGSTGSSTPSPVTINVSPTLNAGAPASGTAAASTTPLGPQAPALPSLQTAPNYNPTFGSNGSDLLSDEVNLTYQLYNVRMLLDRSLTDRLHGNQARLQAVVGFDIDLEPDQDAKNAAAVIQVAATIAPPPPPDAGCDSNMISLVALMPEQGSHNAATLSQSAYAFGGAIASSVFSFGVAGQKRSQVFYLYRDMDTLSFENPATNGNPLIFGWQFRPVLGRKSVDPGLRHMLVVLGLPCSDTGSAIPQISMRVSTQWQKYDWKTQTISPKQPRRTASGSATFTSDVPSTQSSQDRLKPQVSKVSWYPTDALDGIAIVTGDNFFPGTTVRLGNKNYSSAADGLTIKSDKELELSVPLTAAVVGGVVSGRYGQAAPLESGSTATPSSGFNITNLRVFPSGNDMFQINAGLTVNDPQCGSPVTVADLKSKLNPPVALINGVPLAVRPFFSSPSPITLTTFAPAEVVAKMASFTITFPFAGSNWSASIPYYETTLKVTRLGDDKEARLLISATNAADLLCSEWALQLDAAVEFPLTDSALRCAVPRTKRLSFTIPASDMKATDPALKCVDPKTQTLLLDVPAGDINPISAEGCVDAKTQALTLDLAAKDLTAATRKCLDPKTHKLTLTIPAKDLDPPSVAFECVDRKTQTVSFDYPAKDLKPYHRFLLVNRPQPTSEQPHPVPKSPLIGDIPKAEPPPPGPSLDKDQKVSVTLNDVHPVKFTGKHLDEVTKVLFDKTELRIVSQEDKAIVISLSPLVTGKVRDDVGLQLLSEGNDPVIAKLSVTATKTTKTPTPSAPTTPPKKGK